MNCPCCGQPLTVTYHPSWRRDAAGEFQDVGGVQIADCRTPDCAAQWFSAEASVYAERLAYYLEHLPHQR